MVTTVAMVVKSSELISVWSGSSSIDVLDMLDHGGLMLAKDYGNYLSVDGVCHFDPEKAAIKLTGYKYVKPYDMDGVFDALATVGPLSIGINAGVRYCVSLGS